MSEERAERCETCRFWNCYKAAMRCIVNDVNEGDEVGGECRRLPPLYQRHDVGKWALTNQSDWCGEWQPANRPPDATANNIFSSITLPKVESELAARRREVAALVKIHQALRRKVSYEDVERRLQQQRSEKESGQEPNP